MTELYMTLCDSCAEKMDTERHPENPYYLTQVGGPRVMICPKCFKTATCRKYSAESKAMRAFRRELERRQKKGPPQQKTTGQGTGATGGNGNRRTDTTAD